MKKSISTFAVVVMLAGLFTGCEKADNAESTAVVTEEAPPPSASSWQPEVANPQDDHSGHGHDHSGHAH